MERLTEEYDVITSTGKHSKGIRVEDRDSADRKLFEIENIEEEQGVGLVTLFKALKNGYWTKKSNRGYTIEETPTFIEDPEIHLCTNYIETDEDGNITLKDKNVMCICTFDYEYGVFRRKTRLKDYGRTWALTREELEK